MILVGAATLVVSALTSAAVLPFLRRVGVVDRPVARSSHVTPTPRGGGLAVAIALLVGFGISWSIGVSVSWTAPVLVVAFGALGFADDLGGLTVGIRLAVQTLVAAFIGYAVLAEANSLSVILICALGFWIVGYTNIFNFMDGVNGISGLNAALAGLWYAYIGNVVAASDLTMFGVVLAGASLGFLPWNAPHARMFLGDVGSYSLGAAVALLASLALLAGATISLAIAPLCIYIADTSWTLARRIARSQSWREAHRDHVYQWLADRFGHLGAAITTVGFAATCGALALLLADLPALVPLAGFAVVASSYLGLPRLLGGSQRVREDSHG